MKTLVLLALLTLAWPSAAGAEPVECEGLLIGTFDDVVIPRGANCILVDSIVYGDVTAEQNSNLITYNIEVGGSIKADKAQQVVVQVTRVGEDIHISKVAGAGIVIDSEVTNGDILIEKLGDNGEYIVWGTTLGRGNIRIEKNQIDYQGEVSFNTVAGSVRITRNESRTGAVQTVQGNIIAGELRCDDNSEPFLGGPNAAQRAEGQCF